MKQKIWSRAAALVMTICMAITMVPSTALAAETGTTPQADETRTEALILSADDNSPLYTQDDEEQGWAWVANASTLNGSGTLTLNGINFQIPSAKLNNQVEAGIWLPRNSTVVLNGTNKITLTGISSSGYPHTLDAIYGSGIKFIGNGTLEITIQPFDENGSTANYLTLRGIECDETLTIGDENNAPKITVTAGLGGSTSQGIFAAKLSLQNGSLTATGGKATYNSFGIYTTELLDIAKDFTISASAANDATTKEACYFGYGYKNSYTYKTSDDHSWSKQSIENSVSGGTVTEKTDGVHVTQTGSEPVGIQYKGDISKAQSDSLDFTNATENKSGTGWAWDKDSKTLTLSGLNLTVKNGALVAGMVNPPEGGILLPKNATIVLEDNTVNTVSVTAAHSSDTSVMEVFGIYMPGGLTIKGNGKLVVNVQLPSDTSAVHSNLALRGIGAIGDLTIGTGDDTPIIDVTAGDATGRSACIDMSTGGSLKLLSGELTVKSGDKVGTNSQFMSFGINGTLAQINDGFKVTASCGTGSAFLSAACSFGLSNGHSWTEDGFTKSLSNGTAEATQWDLQLKQTDSSQPLSFTYDAGGSTPVDPEPQPETNALDLSNETKDRSGNGWTWDAKDKKLTLTNANFNLNSGVIKTIGNNTEESGILLPEDAVIVLIGKNTLALSGPSNNTIDEFYAIRATNLKIIGDGSLNITMTQSIDSVPENLMMRGISSGSLEIGSDSDPDSPEITVNTEATKTYSTMGIYASKLFLKKGILTANVGYAGIRASNLVEIADGFSITASYTDFGGYACKFHSNDSDRWTVDKIRDSLINGSGTVTPGANDVYITQTRADTPVSLVYQDEPEAVTITAAPEQMTYDGEPITSEELGVTVTKNSDGTSVTDADLTYTYYQDNKELSTAPTNAGTYSVVVSAAEGSGYTGSSDKIEFTIAKRNASIWMNFPIVKVGTTWGAVKEEIAPLTSEGFVNETEEKAIEATLSYRLNDAENETALDTAGEYYYVVDPAETENYKITYENGSFIVSEEYTVSFVTNGGTAVEPQKKLLYDTISSNEASTTRAGYTLAGWYTDPAFANVWAVGDSGDLVMGNMTLYAKWVKDDSLVNYTVTVNNSDTPASKVTVKLKQGMTTQYKADTTGTEVTFTGVVPGTYTLEVEKDGRCSTQVVTITENGSIDVKVPADVSAELIVMWNTPAVLADGLNAEAKNIKTEKKATSVDMYLRVEGKDEENVAEADRTAIQAVTAGKQRLYLDAQVQFKLDSDNDYTTRSETKTVLELIVPVDMSGKYNLGVYRYHGDKAEAFQQTQKNGSHEDGQFYLDGNYIHIFANKFSTYAIAYTTSSGGGTSSGGSSSGGLLL